jgi:hypothetical protein
MNNELMDTMLYSSCKTYNYSAETLTVVRNSLSLLGVRSSSLLRLRQIMQTDVLTINIA